MIDWGRPRAFKVSVEMGYHNKVFVVVGARVNTKDNKWMTPLHRACASGSVVRMIFFLL